MIIDDSEVTGYALSYMLQREGLHVHACRNGDEAISVSQESPSRIYVVDFRMPGMGGDVVTALLRRMQPGALIIGFSAEFKEKEFLSAGANDFILKENLTTQLVPVLRKLQPLLFKDCGTQHCRSTAE